MIIWNYKAIVEQVPRVAFFTITIEYLSPWWEIRKALNGETIICLYVIPSCLLREAMVEHISEWGEDIGLDSIQNNAEHPAAYHCARPAEITEGKHLKPLTRCYGAVVVTL